jgi:hypothetical protein
MHATTAQYLAKAHQQDLANEAAKVRLAREVRQHDSDELRPNRWGISLPHAIRLHRGSAAGAIGA